MVKHLKKFEKLNFKKLRKFFKNAEEKHKKLRSNFGKFSNTVLKNYFEQILEKLFWTSSERTQI